MKIIPTFWVQFKIGEPSLATEGYEHRLRGMNVSKRLAVYRR